MLLNIKNNYRNFLISILVVSVYFFSVNDIVLASPTSNFQQVINAGSVGVDIVDGGYATVGSPAVALGAVTFNFGCQTATGTFGTASQQIYVTNPDAADNGWTVSLAASAPTANWDSAGTDFDFNDNGTSGCVDSVVDTDSLGGQMTVDPSVGTLTVGQCASCTVNNVSKGSSNSFVESSVNSVTVVSGATSSDDIGDWVLTGVSVTQKIPAQQTAAADYDINMVLSIVAS